MSNKTLTLKLLDQFRNKAGCIYTQHKAYKILQELKPLITEKEYRELSTDMNHFELGESTAADVLYDDIKKIVVKYSC